MSYLGYPEYQESKAVWLGHIPSHWKVHRLKWSVTGCSNGVWGAEPDGVDDVVCVRVADFNRETLTVGIDSLTNRAVEPNQLETRKLQRGDLLLEKSGGGEKQLVGCVVYFDHDFDAVCSNFVARMPVEPTLSARYWCYVHAGLYAGKLNYPAIKQSTGIQNLDANEYLNTLAAYPPADEQTQIAAFLDWKTNQIDALIAKKKELMDKLKEKRLAIITQAVTKGLDPVAPLRESGIPWVGDIPKHWEILPIKYLLTAILDTEHKTCPYYDDGEFLVARTPNIRGGKLTLDGAKYTDADGYKEWTSRGVPKPGDILFTREAPAGEACIVPNDSPLCIGQRVVLFRTDSQILESRYAIYSIYGGAARNFIEMHSLGSTVTHFNMSEIAMIPMLAPPISEQTNIAEYLDKQTGKIDRMIGKVESAITHLTEYRTALITAATTGKIDVRHVAIPAPT